MKSLASLHLLLRLVFIALTIALALIDYKTMRLPDKLTFPLFCLGLLNAGLFGVHSLAVSFFSALIAGGFLAFISMVFPGKLGLGDVKFVAALGSYLSFPYIFIAVFFASLIGSLVGGALIVMRRADFQQQIPFGPYLTMGAILTLLWGTNKLAYYWTVLLR